MRVRLCAQCVACARAHVCVFMCARECVDVCACVHVCVRAHVSACAYAGVYACDREFVWVCLGVLRRACVQELWRAYCCSAVEAAHVRAVRGIALHTKLDLPNWSRRSSGM